MKKRLDAIRMSEHDAGLYDGRVARVANDIQQMRVLLQGVDAKEKVI